MSYDALAALLLYPDSSRPPFEPLDRLDPDAREELYTRTFDINPVCSLEVGWHLFGEDYSRGAFLVDVRNRMREHGVEETSELPDHLVHVLRLLDRMEPAQAGSFARRFVQPALDRMLAGFPAGVNPYRLVMEAVKAEVTARHGEAAPEDLASLKAAVGGEPYGPPSLPLRGSEGGQGSCGGRYG